MAQTCSTRRNERTYVVVVVALARKGTRARAYTHVFHVYHACYNADVTHKLLIWKQRPTSTCEPARMYAIWVGGMADKHAIRTNGPALEHHSSVSNWNLKAQTCVIMSRMYAVWLGSLSAPHRTSAVAHCCCPRTESTIASHPIPLITVTGMTALSCFQVLTPS